MNERTDIENMLQDFLTELSDPAVKARYAAEAQEMLEQWDQLAAECAAGKFAISTTELDEMSPHKKAGPLPDRRRTVLEYRGLRVLRWIEQQGVVFYPGKREREIAKRYLRDLPVVFPELVGLLSAIYLYRQSEQATERLRKCDGIIWKDVTTDGNGTLYAVGLSVEAVEKGEAYVQFLFLHELAHIPAPCAPDEHGPQFRREMARLLDRFNRATGSTLEDEPSRTS